MIKWWQQRSLIQRLLVCAVAATLAFLMAAGVGAMTALLVTGDLSRFTKEEPSQKELGPSGQQGNTSHRQQADAEKEEPSQKELSPSGQQGNTSHRQQADAEQERADAQQAQTTYVNRVDDIQSNSVETFLDSHDKLLHYDALSADDVEEMKANLTALQEFANQAGDLNAPQKYREQNDVFLSAIDELHEAAQVAYALAADPTSATQSGFEEYDSHVEKAASSRNFFSDL